jgi:hypothetical protein
MASSTQCPGTSKAMKLKGMVKASTRRLTLLILSRTAIIISEEEGIHREMRRIREM